MKYRNSPPQGLRDLIPGVGTRGGDFFFFFFLGGGGGGGGVQISLTKKKALTFFPPFLVHSLFFRSQMVNFIEIYHFSRFQRRSNIFQVGGGGGPTFSRGGVQLLIFYRNSYNL